jgi:hypothetical protein
MNRRISAMSAGLASPKSFITKGKQRLKQHNDTVYLNNGDEFEIELYNPYKTKVLAKIELNGQSLGSGIILRPGERVFLERYFDEAKKFAFQSYFVDGDNKEVQEAIFNNGDVMVRFYNERVNYPTSSLTWGGTGGINTVITTGAPWYGGNVTYTTSGSGNATYTTNTLGLTNTAFYSSGTNNTANTITTNGLRSANLETGRVEKGSSSDQSFSYDNTPFNTTPDSTNWWKIKPLSTKPVMKEDLVVYCTECGSKRKKDNHKFCPHCGTKF